MCSRSISSLEQVFTLALLLGSIFLRVVLVFLCCRESFREALSSEPLVAGNWSVVLSDGDTALTELLNFMRVKRFKVL